MKKIFFGLLILLLFSCKKEEKAKPKNCSASKSSVNGKFKMYKMSEMAALMEQMYAENQQLKQRIKRGDTIGKFPNRFLQIHKAAMTDESDNDTFFKTQAALFIKSQELIYEDPANAKQHFNDGITSCVKCHEQKCSGPLQKIKKLYID